FPPRAATATEISKQAKMATGHYTRGAPLAVKGELGHTHHPREEFAEFAGGGGRPRAGPLRPGGRRGLGWTHEVHGIRGRRYSPVCRQQPADELGVRLMSVQGFSAPLGGVEVAIAILIATRPLSVRLPRWAAPWRWGCSLRP